MELLQESLDDPAAEPCGRCSVCRGGLPDALRRRGRPPRRSRKVTALLRGEVHLLEPRKMWPGRRLRRAGPDPRRRMAARRGPHAGLRRRARVARDGRARCSPGTRPAPAEVGEACVRLLGQWRTVWRSRPEVVVDLTAGGLPVMTGSVADHLAAVGRLDRATAARAAPAARTCAS